MEIFSQNIFVDSASVTENKTLLCGVTQRQTLSKRSRRANVRIINAGDNYSLKKTKKKNQQCLLKFMSGIYNRL